MEEIIITCLILLCLVLFWINNATTGGRLGWVHNWQTYSLIIIMTILLTVGLTIEGNKQKEEQLNSEINLLKSLNEDLNLDYFTLRKEHVYNKLQLEKIQKELELLKLNKNLTIENAFLNNSLELNQKLFLCYRELDRHAIRYYGD